MTDVPTQSRAGVDAGSVARFDPWQVGLVTIAIIVCLLVGGLGLLFFGYCLVVAVQMTRIR